MVDAGSRLRGGDSNAARALQERSVKARRANSSQETRTERVRNEPLPPPMRRELPLSESQFAGARSLTAAQKGRGIRLTEEQLRRVREGAAELRRTRVFEAEQVRPSSVSIEPEFVPLENGRRDLVRGAEELAGRAVFGAGRRAVGVGKEALRVGSAGIVGVAREVPGATGIFLGGAERGVESRVRAGLKGLEQIKATPPGVGIFQGFEEAGIGIIKGARVVRAMPVRVTRDSRAVGIPDGELTAVSDVIEGLESRKHRTRHLKTLHERALLLEEIARQEGRAVREARRARQPVMETPTRAISISQPRIPERQKGLFEDVFKSTVSPRKVDLGGGFVETGRRENPLNLGMLFSSATRKAPPRAGLFAGVFSVSRKGNGVSLGGAAFAPIRLGTVQAGNQSPLRIFSASGKKPISLGTANAPKLGGISIGGFAPKGRGGISLMGKLTPLKPGGGFVNARKNKNKSPLNMGVRLG